MDGPRATRGSGAARPELPVWERTPRAVPPPLGSPPPVQAKRAGAAIGVRAGAIPEAQQGSGKVVTPDRPTPWGAKPLDAKPLDAKPLDPVSGLPPVAAPPVTPTGRVPVKRLPRGIAVAAGAAVAVVAVAGAALVMRSGTPVGTRNSAGPVSRPPVSGTPGNQGTQTSPSVPNTPLTPTSPAAQPTQPASGGIPSPFAQALADLAGQPMLRYSGDSPDGHASWQLTVTSGGEAQGDLDLGDGRLGVLLAGGRTYFRAADTASAGLLGELPSGVTASSVRGRWVTGDSALAALLPSALASAGNLAASLRSSPPAQDAVSPSPSGSAARVDGVPATPVTTSAGTVYISTAQPYRVLRVVPNAGSGQAADVETVSQTAANSFFSTLIDQTKTLTDALDFGISFAYDQGPKLYCSDSSCTVAVNGVVASAADPDAAPDGAVVADVTARVTVNGQPAGGCEAIAKLPLGRPANITCQDQDAASVVQSLGGGDLGFDVRLQFAARSVPQADVSALVTGELNEQGAGGGTRSPARGDLVREPGAG